MTNLTDCRFAAVIFDNDMTLVDSSRAVTAAWAQWADHYAVPEADRLPVHGRTARDLALAMVGPELVDEAVTHIVELESELDDGVTALPGARDALESLPDTRRAIATSALVPVLTTRLDAAELPLPAVVVTAEEVERGKPDPEVFLLAAQRLGVAASACLVVEDAPAGLEAARAAGCATLAVTTSHAADELDADLVVPDLSHVRFVEGPDGVRVELVRIEENA